jgi:hypothetical protein
MSMGIAMIAAWREEKSADKRFDREGDLREESVCGEDVPSPIACEIILLMD